VEVEIFRKWKNIRTTFVRMKVTETFIVLDTFCVRWTAYWKLV